MKKRYIRILICILILCAVKQVCFGISNDFIFVIDTIGIPRYNVYGDEINEDIYYTYNVFVYTDPINVANRTSTQRFKEVPNKGKWTQNGGVYTGQGIRGEYDILGTDYSGNYIYNVYFPVDAIPETTPDKWNYVQIAGALDSWNDNSKYKYREQIDYMKNRNLMFDTINYSNNTIDPYDLREYNISPNKIGLDKVMLNTASTWKTYGIVSINRINNKGQIRYATLATSPMAASSDIKSYINVSDKIILDENSDQISFEINFGANAINLNNYAKKEHIKEINSDLYIDDNKVSQVTSSKTDSISKTYTYKISRDKYQPGTYTLNISNSSYLYTEFYVDGLMRKNINKNVTIQIMPKKVVPIEDIKVKVLEKNDIGYVLKDLIETNITKEAGAIGIIEKEKHIAMKIKKSINNFNKDDLKVTVDGKNIEYNILIEDSANIVLDIKIPDGIKSSITGWENYRNNKGNYFDIDFNNIGNRVSKCNQINVIYEKSCKELYNKNIKIDTLDSYKYNINYIFENGVVVNNSNYIKLSDWLDEK